MSDDKSIFEDGVAALKVADDSDSDDSDDAELSEDPRIARMREFASSHSPEEIANLVKSSEYSQASVVINDSMCMNKQAIAAHVLVSALITPGEFQTKAMSKQVAEKVEVLKEFAESDSEYHQPLLGALEANMLLSHKTHPENTQVMRVLVELFNADVFGDDEEAVRRMFQDWSENPTSSRAFGLDKKQADEVRELAVPFFEFIDEDDESEDDE